MDHKNSGNPSSSRGVNLDQASCSYMDEEGLIDDEEMLIENEEESIEDEVSIDDEEELIEEKTLNKDDEGAIIGDKKEATFGDQTKSLKDEETDLLDDEEYVTEETLIQVSMADPNEMSYVNSNSNIQLFGLETDSPTLQIENKVFCFSKWKYVPGTALFFEPKKVAKTTESLYDKTCETELKYIGSTRKCLEMTRKDIIEK